MVDPGGLENQTRGPSMPAHPDISGLTDAVQRYFDLMYDSDVSRFDLVFRSSAQLHGFRKGQMTMWPAATFKEIIAGRPSPKSQSAPREEEILLVDFASADQALVKVRVRINAVVFVDHLTYHRIDGDWLITSKAFHVERKIS
jgi:Putative lumazine-binding